MSCPQHSKGHTHSKLMLVQQGGGLVTNRASSTNSARLTVPVTVSSMNRSDWHKEQPIRRGGGDGDVITCGTTTYIRTSLWSSPSSLSSVSGSRI